MIMYVVGHFDACVCGVCVVYVVYVYVVCVCVCVTCRMCMCRTFIVVFTFDTLAYLICDHCVGVVDGLSCGPSSARVSAHLSHTRASTCFCYRLFSGVLSNQHRSNCWIVIGRRLGRKGVVS